MARLEANLRRYVLFQSLVMTPLFVPVVVLFWRDNGLDAFEIYLLQGLYAVAVVLLEVPTGTVADRLGKRTSLLCAAAMLSLALVVYALTASFLGFLIAEVVFAAGAALASGADTALLYDTLQRLGRTDEFRRREGTARALQMLSFAGSCVLGGFVGEVSYRATIWLSLVGPIVALVVAWGFVEASPPSDGDSSDGGRGSYRAFVASALRFVLRHQLVRWYVLFFAVLAGSSTWLLWLYQPYMEWTGIPVWAFGLAFAGFNTFAALSSRLAHRFDDALGRLGALLGLMVLQVAPLVLMAVVVTPASFLFILCHQVVRAISRPVVADRILAYTHADKRATVLSIAALGGRLFFAVTAPLVGWLAREQEMDACLLYQAALLGAVLLALVVLYGRIPAKYFVVKESVRARH